MLKRTFLLLLLFFPLLANGQDILPNSSFSNDIIKNYRKLSLQQLSDTADYYYEKNIVDTALLCYSLIINTPVKNADIGHQKRLIGAYNRSGIFYCQLGNYHGAYDFFIKALFLCEKYAIVVPEKPKIYTNIGNIYAQFRKYDIAKSYHLKALDLCEDSIGIVAILNNVGNIELENGKTDSAFYFLGKALQISKQCNNLFYLDHILGNTALLYQKEKQHDSSLYYFHLSLDEAKKNNKIENIAEALSAISKLYLEINKTDSALFYINLSNTIAGENNLLAILAKNHLILSKIEESKGHITSAFEQFKKYVNLRDSILNVGTFSEINQLQRFYETSKTNEQIEQLIIEQRVKEQTIRYQNIIQLILLIVLLLVSGVAVFIFLQKRRLNTAYNVLFEKNMEIIDLQQNSSEKYKTSTLSNDMQEELLNRILKVMEDTSIICDTDFSLDKLAELVQSNSTYISQVINSALKKSFRSFLNSYRIHEAQRLFASSDTVKYTIEFVALKVGFKSRRAFGVIFKEVTGVTPSFYLQSLQK